MKFSANISDLQAILPKIISVIPTRSPLAQLENLSVEIKANMLSLMGTDLEVCLRSRVEIASKTDGAFNIPAKKLAEIIKTLPDGDITISVDKSTQRVTLLSAQGKYIMPATDGELPDMSKEFKPEASTTVSGLALRNMISTVMFAASGNEFRVAMMGLLFQFSPDGTTCVATDGNRLARITDPNLKTETERDVIVPAKTAHLILKSFSDSEEITISFSATQIEFKSKQTTILSRLIDEQYPNYQAVIPRENERNMLISKAELQSSLRRVMIFSDQDTRVVRLDIGKNSLKIGADNADEGSEAAEELTCDFNYDEFSIGFDGKFIEDALSHIDSQEVAFKFSTSSRACIVEPTLQKKEDILMLMMPKRLVA
jgi:DNA polymerase-3 subunit beta